MGSWAGGREVHGRPLEEKEMKEQIGQSHRGCSEGWVMTEGRQGAWADIFSTRCLWRCHQESWRQELPELGVSVLFPSSKGGVGGGWMRDAPELAK